MLTIMKLKCGIGFHFKEEVNDLKRTGAFGIEVFTLF